MAKQDKTRPSYADGLSRPGATSRQRRSGKHQSEKQARRSCVSITFIGERGNDRYQIQLYGKKVELPYAALNLLIRLVISRGTSATGFLGVSPVTINRLRRALDKAGGPGTGKSLIETGCGEEYRLKSLRQEIVGQITIDPSFFELEKLKVFSKEQGNHLRRLCHRLQS